MVKNLSQKFIERLYHLNQSDLPQSTIHQAKRCLIDYLAACYAGSKILEEKCYNYLELFDEGGHASIIGLKVKSNMQNAILWNGMNSHVAELDDGVRYGVLHPGSPIISALIPVAKKENVKNKDLLRGIIIGYETAICLASSIQPSHYELGFHPTSTCGTIGSAIGIASMLNLSLEDMMNALSAASLSAYGTLKVIEDGSNLKPYNSGRAALNGYIASCLARISVNGDTDPLSGKLGLLSMLSSSVDTTKLMGDTGKMAIEKIYVKPYASCRHSHPSIEAVITLKNKYGIIAKNVKRIVIKTYKGVIGKHDHKKVNNPASAKMSIPFSVAIALYTGKAGLHEFNKEIVENKDVISLCNNTSVLADDEITALVPDKRAAFVSIEMKNGDTYSHRVDLPKGEPENPVSDIELKDKFIQLASYAGIDITSCESIFSHIMNCEKETKPLYEFL